MPIARIGLLVVLAVLAGCLRSTSFICTTNAECTSSVDGICQPVGFCSFPDVDCPDGQRYGDYSGKYAGQCVGDVPGIDGGIDAAIDAPAPPCPATYVTLPGVGTHVYGKLAPATWMMQRTLCSAPNRYLVIPDDATELQAVLTFAAAEIWVGISDETSEGSFVTVLGASATFLPWEPAEPDNAPGNADCVVGRTTAMYIDDRCSTVRPAVCECVP